MNRIARPLLLVLGALPAVCGCVETWKAQQITAVGQLAVPECAVVDAKTGKVYVSNIDTDTCQYWADDGKASLALLAPGGTPMNLRWRVSNMACDGVAVYVSDTAAGVVYRMAADGVTRVKAPAGVNGIAFSGGKMYAVSWDLHEVYELDPTGQGEPVPLGLARHFKTPDGIEGLQDGTLLVSDMHGNRVAAVTPDRENVYTLVELPTPADIGLDRERRLLYIPQFERDCVTVCRLIPVEP